MIESNKVEYTYEQMATMVVQEQGLVKCLSDEIDKLRTENAVLKEKLLTIRKVFE